MHSWVSRINRVFGVVALSLLPHAHAGEHPPALQTPPPEALIRSKKWTERRAAFNQIWQGLHIDHQAGGCGDLNGGASVAVRSAVTRLLAAEADSQEAAEKSVGTPNEQEIDEDRSEYFASLIQATECLHDPASVDVLLRPIVLGTGMMAIRGIAYMGDAAFPRVWAHYNAKRDAEDRELYQTVLRTMLVEHYVKEPKTVRQLEQMFLDLGRSTNAEDRSIAIPALAAMNDPRGRVELEQIANSDPQTIPAGRYARDPNAVIYPLRKEARYALLGAYIPPR